MMGPFLVIDMKPVEMNVPNEFALWTPFGIECPRCNIMWLYTTAGSRSHQRSGAMLSGRLLCPSCGGDPIHLVGFKFNGYDPIGDAIEKDRMPIEFYRFLFKDTRHVY